MRPKRATRFILVVSGTHVAAEHSTNRLTSQFAPVASQSDLDLIVVPETTNIKYIKLVTRRGEIGESQWRFRIG
jgi:hypothetical protein